MSGQLLNLLGINQGIDMFREIWNMDKRKVSAALSARPRNRVSPSRVMARLCAFACFIADTLLFSSTWLVSPCCVCVTCVCVCLCVFVCVGLCVCVLVCVCVSVCVCVCVCVYVCVF